MLDTTQIGAYTGNNVTVVLEGEEPAAAGNLVEVPRGTLPSEMAKAGALDYKVEKRPLFLGNGQQVESHYALCREDNGDQLDIVSRRWRPVQNTQAVSFFDEVVKGGNLEMEALGTFGDGKLLWGLASYKDGFTLPGGDRTQDKLLLVNPHRYGSSLQIGYSAVRLWCANVVTGALRDADVARYSHATEFDGVRVGEYLSNLDAERHRFSERAALLRRTDWSDATTLEYLNRVFNNKRKIKAEEAKIRREALSPTVEKVRDLLDTQPGADACRGTAWNAYNAVTYYTNHVSGKEANRARSVWTGRGRDINLRGLKVATDLINA